MHSQLYDQVHGGHWKHVLGICWRRALNLAKEFRDRLGVWRSRVRRRNELMTLSDRDLRDFKWTRAEADAEARKPFWRV
jgi:uncharacterized protein YjiS (DUF1127 family)